MENNMENNLQYTLLDLMKEKHLNMMIIGKEGSGKSTAFCELLSILTNNKRCLAFSNDSSVLSNLSRPENLTFFYKSKDVKTIPLKFLKGKYDYVFIDNECDNYDEIKKNLKGKTGIVGVKTINDYKDIDENLKNIFDYFIEVEIEDRVKRNKKITNIYKKSDLI